MTKSSPWTVRRVAAASRALDAPLRIRRKILRDWAQLDIDTLVLDAANKGYMAVTLWESYDHVDQQQMDRLIATNLLVFPRDDGFKLTRPQRWEVRLTWAHTTSLELVAFMLNTVLGVSDLSALVAKYVQGTSNPHTEPIRIRRWSTCER
jgi:hypothetical protein